MIRQLDIYHDLLGLHLAHPQRYPFLLESVAHGTPHARYDILFAFPGQSLALTDYHTLKGDGLLVNGLDFLDNLDAWWARERTPTTDAESNLPFSGGWFVYLGYELAGQVEPCLDLSGRTSCLPIAFATRIPAAVIRDHALKQTFLVTEDSHASLLDVMMRDLDAVTMDAGDDLSHIQTNVREDEPEQYLNAVRRIKDYIVDGDVFQVNLSRSYSGVLGEGITYAQLYRNLRRHNPAPFAGLVTYNGSAILSSSPERLVRVRDDVVETRPIAGTRPRGIGDEDRALSQTLLAHPKERAEHVMLIDLERNDLGRICVPGSVQVDELMGLESYAHVHHIVSNVRGTKRPDVTPGQVIRAVFPGGTITGCPKVRCMEIIAELEQAARGPYTGSMGYLNHDGSLDLNILIRTMWVEDNHVQLRVGAGVVADSVPEAELEETRAKARGLLLALGVAFPSSPPAVKEED
ncbi:MAG: aminodeoxychorismate synthase component I [Gammaproteobacteria bacterium]|nr:aminodeoxychorismate synthase component I [Gammaproteobacteria bacterium]